MNNGNFSFDDVGKTKPTQSTSFLIAKMAMWIVIGLAVLWVGYTALNRFAPQYLQRSTVASSVPDIKPVTGPVLVNRGVAVPSGNLATGVAKLSTSTKVVASGCVPELWTIPWNATVPVHAANGGVLTTDGSLMAQNGVQLKLVRMPDDNYDNLAAGMLKFAEGVKKGEACPEGPAYGIIMGNGYSGFASGLEEQMSKIGQGFEVVHITGYSAGEDKCMMPYAVEKNPQLLKGMTFVGVDRDGDPDICMLKAAQNKIPFNPDNQTYDRGALNIISVKSLGEASARYIAGTCETRSVVVGGKITNEKATVCPDGVATWTPEDVNVAMKKGGLASVASTKEYAYQMPAVIIGNRDYMKRNPKMVEGMIRASLDAAEAIKVSDQALTLGATVQAAVYKENDAAYWKKYYHGVVENDKQGVPISLGGSRVAGYADMAIAFGLDGKDNLYKRVYKQIGDTNAKYYPTITPTYPAYESVVNTSYLAGVLKNAPVAMMTQDVTPKYDSAKPMERIIANRNWSIEFDTGKATIRPGSIPAMEEMLNQIAVTNLQVEIAGHTDIVGTQESNLKLSKARAEAIKAYLMSNAPSGFPDSRIRARGMGDTQPIADNATAEGKSKNRRVEVKLGTTGN